VRCGTGLLFREESRTKAPKSINTLHSPLVYLPYFRLFDHAEDRIASIECRLPVFAVHGQGTIFLDVYLDVIFLGERFNVLAGGTDYKPDFLGVNAGTQHLWGERERFRSGETK